MCEDTRPGEGDNPNQFTAKGALEILAEMDVPPEERPDREYLAAISSPARHASLYNVCPANPDEGHDRSVEIIATPEELRAHVEYHIEPAIERKIGQGELERGNGGEK